MNPTCIENTWQGDEEFKACVREWAEKIGVQPTRIQVQEMRQKWASCSRAGIITLSTELLRRDRRFGEAVIVHELLHLKVRNHGKLFKSLFRAYLPGGEQLLDEYLSRLD